jgi:hypothetical protein
MANHFLIEQVLWHFHFPIFIATRDEEWKRHLLGSCVHLRCGWQRVPKRKWFEPA